MESIETEARRKIVTVRFNAREYTLLRKMQGQTTEKTVSNYIRNLALRKPVIVKYRNATGDDFLRDMLSLKKELHALGNNYNQAVKKLHVLEKIPEFRSWILIYETSRQAFISKVQEIHSKIADLYEQWLQK